eukprot:4482261-Amphidinium_carterae.1
MTVLLTAPYLSCPHQKRKGEKWGINEAHEALHASECLPSAPPTPWLQANSGMYHAQGCARTSPCWRSRRAVIL